MFLTGTIQPGQLYKLKGTAYFVDLENGEIRTRKNGYSAKQFNEGTVVLAVTEIYGLESAFKQRWACKFLLEDEVLDLVSWPPTRGSELDWFLDHLERVLEPLENPNNA